MFIELKAHHRKLEASYNDNLSDYKDVITDYLFERLHHPDYGEDDIGTKTEKVYEFLVGRYAAQILSGRGTDNNYNRKLQA